MWMKVTCALIISGNKVLITKRPLHKNQGGKWEFPGGKMMENETAEECIVREIAEELDLEIEVLEELNSIVHSYPALTIELIPLECAIVEGSITLHEHTSMLWADLLTLSTIELCEADKQLLPQLEQLLD
jgi:8-oxo-dGTP diphosphatase